MFKLWKSRTLVIGAALLAGVPAVGLAGPAGAATQSYTTPGCTTYVVGAGVTAVQVDAYGAQGGGPGGGTGGHAGGVLSVTPGQSLTVCVGGASAGAVGGVGGGGNSGDQTVQDGWGGGGGSSVAVAGVPVIVAGGGGGQGLIVAGPINAPNKSGDEPGGNGGGASGTACAAAVCGGAASGSTDGSGGASSAAGVGDCSSTAGANGGGGTGGSGGVASCIDFGTHLGFASIGGGGGGGYGGGGGGGSAALQSVPNGGGGGGGSGFVDPSVGSPVNTAGGRSGDGEVDITPLTPPASPTITSVLPGAAGSVSVTFTGDGNPNATFTVTCQSSAGGAPVSVSGPSSPIVVAGLPNVATQTITCTVTETVGALTSSPSSPAPITISGYRGGPLGNCASTLTAPTAPSSAPGDGSAVVSWGPATSSPPGCIAGYIVTPYVGTTAQIPILLPGTSTTTILKGLTNGQPYTFTIAAENGIIIGPASTPTKPITVGAPAAAAVLHATRASRGAITLSFTTPKSNGAPVTRYLVACKATNGGATRKKAGTSSPITVTGLSAGKTYRCNVAASNRRGTGPLSRASGRTTA